MNSIEQEIANSIQAMETGESRYIDGRRIVTQSEIDLADMEAQQALEAQQVNPEMMAEGQAITPQLEGEPQPIPGTGQGAQVFGGVEDQTNIEAIAGPVDGMGVGEFLETTGRVFSGAAGGAATATLGLPGDVIGIIEGIVKASGAPEGEGLDAFLQGMGRVSEQYGSAATTKMLYDFVDRLDITDEAKEQIKAGSALLGEWGEIPGVAVAAKAFMNGVEGLTSYAAGAQGRIADRGMTLQSGLDPLAAVDEVIAGVQRAIAPSKPEGVTLAPASDAPKVNQLSPEYRVTVEGFTPEGTGKQAFVPKAINPKNFAASSEKLDVIATEFPDPLSSPEAYALMMAKVNNSNEVQAPPAWLIENANNPEQFAKWFDQLTPGQIQAADEGLAIQSKFQDAYRAGAGPQITGQLMLWSILSRMLSAFPHESGFKDLAQAASPFIDKAARGEWSDADSASWLATVKENIPSGSPGKSATSNANDFGALFLRKMAQVDETGKSGLMRLHEMIADPNMSSVELRRAFYGIAEGTGIQNKILSFALLVSGRNDVVVLDRIQINRMWGGGEKIYDDVNNQFDGAQGLVHYEALERALSGRVQDLYNRVGRSDKASVGRYHWESWVLSSGQVVGHPTLEGVVKTASGAAEPVVGIPVKEGRFHQFLYGAEYEKLPGGGFRYVYRTSDGVPYEFSKSEIDSVFKEVKRKGSKILPPDFPGVKSFEGGNRPWYDYEGVDRGKIDELIRNTGKPVNE